MHRKEKSKLAEEGDQGRIKPSKLTEQDPQMAQELTALGV